MGRERAVKQRQGNRRETLLAAAARRFFRDGYATASMRDIAADAGMGVLLTGGDILQDVMRELPTGAGAAWRRAVKLRDDYEAIFAHLLDALHLPVSADRHQLRLMLMGAMNWAHNWHKPGADSPEDIARSFVRYLKSDLDGAS